MYDALKKWYQDRLFTLENERQAVKAAWITAEQFKEITGQNYEEESGETIQ